MTGLDLRKLREQLGISVKLLSERTGYHSDYVRTIEGRGRPAPPSFQRRCLGAMLRVQSERSEALKPHGYTELSAAAGGAGVELR